MVIYQCAVDMKNRVHSMNGTLLSNILMFHKLYYIATTVLKKFDTVNVILLVVITIR